VLAITDGDTLEVRLSDGSVDKVRLIGINSPEKRECWADEATLALSAMAPVGAEVGLTSDRSDRDRFDRLLRYIWVGSFSINEDMVRRGAAISRRYPPDTAMAERFESAQAEAKNAGLGLWASEACGPSPDADIRITEVEYDAPGDDHQNLNEEWIRLRNAGDNVVDMSDWGIRDESASNRFLFPVGFVLAPREYVTVYTGCSDNFGTDLYWCSVGSAVWNNDGDTAFLLDPSGNTHDSVSYAPATTTTTAPSTTTTKAVPTTTEASNCHPSYEGQCVPVGVSVVDFLGGTGDGPYYTGRVKVVGPDVYRLDHDNDGIGCEIS
jgi:micrococcal nuclease